MEGLVYLCIVVAGIVLIITNEFFTWKIWPRIFSFDISARHQVAFATVIIDPLVASIICPLASDLYYSLEWLQMCDFYFAFFVLLALFLMYGSGLVMSFKIISTLIPEDCISRVQLGRHRCSTLVYFTLSSLLNFILTWMTLLLAKQGAEEFYPSEECFPFMVNDKIFFVCAVSYCFQVLFTVFYAHLSSTVNRRLSLVRPVSSYNALIVEDEVSSVLLSPRDGILKYDLLAYGAISLVCLLLSHGLRSAFVLCSCLPFLRMASGIYWTNYLILAKLPSVGLIYYVLSRFI